MHIYQSDCNLYKFRKFLQIVFKDTNNCEENVEFMECIYVLTVLCRYVAKNGF